MQLNIFFNTSASVWYKSAIAVFELLQFKPNRFEIIYNSSPYAINPVSGKPSSFKTKKGKVADLNLLFKEIDFLTQRLYLFSKDETVFITYNELRKLNSIDVTQDLFNYLKNDINALGFIYHNPEDNPSLFDARFNRYSPFFLFKPAYIICLFPALLNILASLNTSEIAKISYDYKESNGSHYFKLFKQPDLISNKEGIHFLMFFTCTSTKRSINLPTQLKFIEIISTTSVVSEFNQWLYVSQLRWQEMYTVNNNDIVYS